MSVKKDATISRVGRKNKRGEFLFQLDGHRAQSVMSSLRDTMSVKLRLHCEL